MPWIMQRLLPLFAALLLLGCAQEATEEASDEAADTTAVEGISLANLAGTWNMRTTSTDPGDTVVTTYDLVVDESGWTMHLPDRDPVLASVVIEGDSVIADAGPFESVRRAPGTMVTTHTVYRMEGDRLVGTITAHYQTADADSVLVLNTEGTRAP